MLLEKYVTIPIDVPIDEYDSETEYEEIEVDNNDLKHYIDTYCTAEDVLNYAKQISPDEFNSKESNADLDLAYEILIEEFDNHDDIPDIRDLREYIEDCIYRDYEKEATSQYSDRALDIEDEKILDRDYRNSVL